MSTLTVPARLAFDRAVAYNREHGHENKGFLSEQYGFLPSTHPLLQLPESHRAWDQMVDQLPELFRSLKVRARFDEMPVLPADENSLPDLYLCRASSIISIFAHSYVRVEPDAPESIPDCIQRPWEEIARRLNRPAPFLSYTDLIIYNWRLRNPDLPDPIRVENLDLLVPTVGNEEERIFYLTQVEIAGASAPFVTATIRAQEAALAGDEAALERELYMMLELLHHLAEVSFQKISANPYSKTAVDQIVWAKSVAPFAVPVREGLPGPSGTAAPLFHLMDAFLSRPQFDSVLGTEAMHLSHQSPQHWQDFIGAIGKFSVKDFVDQSDNRHLQGLFNAVIDAYASDKGFLGVHRLKAYGFLELAFKVGRSVTIGGFKGLFKDKTWDQIDHELVLTRDERYIEIPEHCYFVTPKRSDIVGIGSREWTCFAALDTTDTGLSYRPGDRIGILPENNEQLIRLTLDALQATGDEMVRLNRTWQAALRLRDGEKHTDTVPLSTLLKYGKLRPLTRDVAKRLHAITASEPLNNILHARMEDQWEVWDILNILYAGGFDTRRLWKAEPWDKESICRIIPPETFRLYSIASSMEPNSDQQTLRLTVSGLEYESADSPYSIAEPRFGTASNFVRHITELGEEHGKQVSLRVVPGMRFHLPADPQRPIVMFAGGSGIAPFMGFLEERTRDDASGENWLFFSTRTPDQLFHQERFGEWVADHKVNLRVAFSRADKVLAHHAGSDRRLVIEDGPRSRIDKVMEADENAAALWQLMRPEEEGGLGAYFYICGRTRFAVSIMDSLKRVVYHFAEGSEEERGQQADRMIREMVANGRYLQDIFTTYSGAIAESENMYDASEVVLHNDPENGYWLVVSGRVYDVSEFINLHIGGDKIVIGNSGIDATKVYQSVMHHVNSEVDAMLGMYEIGVIRRLDFGQEWGIAIGPDGLFFMPLDEAFRVWVRYLYLIVEMQNALNNDFSFLDKSTTYQEPADELTPLKLQYVTEAHRRFVNNYLDGIIAEDLQVLWSITSGLCDPNRDIRWMEQEIERIHTKDETRLGRRCDDMMWQMIHELKVAQGIEYDRLLDRLADFSDLVQREDKRLFREFKEALRSGVILFETYQSDVIRAGAEQLMASVESIPTIVEQYYERLATGMIALDSHLAANLSQDAVVDIDHTRQELPGHGTRIDYSALQRPSSDLDD
jgi:sulfite reductase alpha subunit-like flavoprotein